MPSPENMDNDNKKKIFVTQIYHTEELKLQHDLLRTLAKCKKNMAHLYPGLQDMLCCCGLNPS